jgi:hypothetical protein
MKYFLDTEFHERKKPIKFLGITIDKVDTIELISIGIVSENNDTYYAICNDFDVDAAWNNEWLRDNVLHSVYQELLSYEGTYGKTYHPDLMEWNKSGLKNLLRWHGKSKARIAKEVTEYVYKTSEINDPNAIANWEEVKHKFPVEFYGYFADYDWVVFCWLFGRMIDLPKGFPYFCMDLKQMMVERGIGAEWKYNNCPDPEGEHDALIDAKWNMKLYNLIKDEPR